LPPEEQERINLEEAERWKRDKPGLIVAVVLGLVTLFVLWPMAAYWMSKERWPATWNAGRVVSQDSKQICKEVETCSPCVPIADWHKEVICEPIDRK
jgi:hypothetical protein